MGNVVHILKERGLLQVRALVTQGPGQLLGLSGPADDIDEPRQALGFRRR